MTEWEEYILEKSNAVTFPKYKDEPCFVLDEIGLHDVAEYGAVTTFPCAVTEKHLKQNKKILENKIKGKTGKDAEFGYVVKRTKTNPYAKGILYVSLIIFLHKEYSKFVKEDKK